MFTNVNSMTGLRQVFSFVNWRWSPVITRSYLSRSVVWLL